MFLDKSPTASLNDFTSETSVRFVEDARFVPAVWLEAAAGSSGRGNAAVKSAGPSQVTCVVNNPMVYYMGTTGGGLWKTEDSGATWSNISDGYFSTGSIGAVAVSESHPNIVYVGMGEHAPRGVMTSYGDGVYKSYDAGKTWTKIGKILTLFM